MAQPKHIETGLVEAAREISAGRLKVLGELRQALLDDDVDQVLVLARKLTGLYDEPTSKPS